VVERGVVERERSFEEETDRAGELLLLHLEEREVEHVFRQERLPQPAEEDLHAGLHELPLRTLAGAVELHEAVEVRLERLLRRLDDRVRAELRLEPPRLPLDLVPELARERREVLVPRSRKREERRDRLL